MTAEDISRMVSQAAQQAAAQLDKVAGKISALANGSPIPLQISTAQAEQQLDRLHGQAQKLLTDLDGNQVSASAAAAAQRSYRAAIRELTALKTLSHATYEQELAYLLTIRENMNRLRMSAKDALDLEKRLSAVQAQIAARDAQSLDTLLSGVMDALKNRYQSMRDAELAMLDQSRQAWQDWKESSTDAIHAQIDALDALTQAEDRAAEEETYLRRIEKLQQALAYEQNAFNRGQLSAQLAEAQEAYEGWRVQTAREDQKVALTAQMQAVSERADAELAKLSQQADSVSEAYAARLQAAALRAEAEKQLLAGTQADILQLITGFAPDYNAAGQTLGEQMLAGFMEKVGSISGWMEHLNAMIGGVQQNLNAALQTAADSFYQEHPPATAGVTITQQNTFNTPVESPADTAWRIRQANEALAAELLHT